MRTQVSVGCCLHLCVPGDATQVLWGQEAGSGGTGLGGLLAAVWVSGCLQVGQALTCLCASVKKARVLDAEGLALGSVIATSKKARRDLIDDSFNR